MDSWKGLGSPAQASADDETPAARERRQAAEIRLLSRELERLRKAGGFTPARLARETFLVHLLGGEHEPFEVLRERFVSAVHSLRDPEPALLLAIFGLADEARGLVGLQERRAAYGVTIGRKAPTVADLEPAALDHLRTQLLTGWYPLSPVGTFVSPAHNGAAFESVHIEMLFKDRIWQGTRETWNMLALFDEADYLAYSYSHPGTPVSLTDDFTVQPKVIGDSVQHQFHSREPMRRGDSYRLQFVVRPKPGDDAEDSITETSRAFHEPTRLARFEVTFLGQKPDLMWSYERLSYFERPGSPQDGLRPNLDRQRIAVEFDDLQSGLFSGIAWRWTEGRR